MDLTDRERAILDFERVWWKEPGPKETLIRARLHLSPARYYELLSALSDTACAFDYDPLTVKRLRRQRDERRRARFERHRADPRST